ncbi:MAG: hypothetical protein AAGF12_01855 [Myxococcota bacterium]
MSERSLPRRLVGRASELDDLRSRFASGDRVVALWGGPGVGKSALAGSVFELESRTEDTVLVDLHPVHSPDAMLDEVGTALKFFSADPSRAALGRALRARGNLLLFLDGVDRLGSALGPLIEGFLLDAPDLRICITTRDRQVLEPRIGESVADAIIEVAPLSLDAGRGPSDAATLFAEAAAEARPGFVPSATDWEFIEALSRDLEGNPLALLLGAARMKVMSPKAIHHRIQKSQGILRQEGSDPRHQSLAVAAHWSIQALSESERATLRQCSVFSGGFLVTAAEEIIDAGSSPTVPEASTEARPSTLALLESLRSKSLLNASADGSELRLAVPGFLRETGPKLQGGERLAVEARHAAYYYARLGELEDQNKRLQFVRRERRNLLAIIKRSLARGPVTAEVAEPALGVRVALGPALLDRGPLAVFQKLVEPALEATKNSGADPRLIGKALAVRGRIRFHQGNTVAGGRDLAAALDLARKTEDPSFEAQVELLLSELVLAQRDSPRARPHLERAAALYRSLGDRSKLADGWRLEAIAASLSGDPGLATTLTERAVALHRELESELSLAADLRVLAGAQIDAGATEPGRQRAEEARTLATQLDDPIGAAEAQALAGFGATVDGEYAIGERALRLAVRTLAASGFRRPECEARLWLALLRTGQGEVGDAYANLTTVTALLSAKDPLYARASAYAALLDLRAGRPSSSPASSPDPLAQALFRFAGDEAAAAALSAMKLAEARLAVQLFGAQPIQAATPSRHALRVSPDRATFCPPGSDERVPLDRRPSLQRVFAFLVEEKLRDPSASHPWESLLTAGWPGEKILSTAGAHRVRVAVSTLRKLGLRDVLVTTETGYRLDPAVRLVMEG